MNLFTKIDLIEPVELSNNFDLKVQDDLSGIDEDVMMESLFIEIVRSNTKNIAVEVI